MEFFYTGENPILIRASKEAAGLDVTVDHVEHVSDNYKIVHIDLAIEYPEGYIAMLVPRSSIAKYGWVLANSVGVIDRDYRGPLQMHFRAVDFKVNILKGGIEWAEFPYDEQDRCGQLIFVKADSVDPTFKESLSETTRNTGGFGSTDGGNYNTLYKKDN
jgi:dUTP pyrophosphatase